MSEELFNAIRINDLNRVRELIAAGADVNKKDKYGYTALMVASIKHNPDVVNALIAAGADVNFQDSDSDNDSDTALMIASQDGYIDIVNALIEAGANVNLQNNRG